MRRDFGAEIPDPPTAVSALSPPVTAQAQAVSAPVPAREPRPLDAVWQAQTWAGSGVPGALVRAGPGAQTGSSRQRPRPRAGRQSPPPSPVAGRPRGRLARCPALAVLVPANFSFLV